MSTIRYRERNFMEKQPYIFGYGAGISVFSPFATVYQLCKLTPELKNTSYATMGRLSAMIFVPQTLLKVIQMNISTPVKEYLNPWAAFALVGVLQGGVYGQANIYFCDQLKYGKKLALSGMFRGVAFAACRDMISQGVPFVFSSTVKKIVFDPLFPADGSDSAKESFVTPYISSIKHWSSVLFTSVVATILSQGLHNCQVTMQSDASLGYLSTLQRVWKNNGIAAFYRGSEARIGLLLVVNILNEALLKKAWSNVPVKEE